MDTGKLSILISAGTTMLILYWTLHIGVGFTITLGINMTNTKQLLLTYMDALRAFDKKQPRVYDFWTLPEYDELTTAQDVLLDRDRGIENLLVRIVEEPYNCVASDVAEQALKLLRGNV